jgi:hypothetical protein
MNLNLEEFNQLNNKVSNLLKSMRLWNEKNNNSANINNSVFLQ